MTARGARANRSERLRRPPRQARELMSGCGRRRSPRPRGRSLNAVKPHVVSVLLCLLCLLGIGCHEADGQSSPLRPALRAQHQDPNPNPLPAHDPSPALSFQHERNAASSEDLAAATEGRRRRDLATIRYTNSTLRRRSALTIYRSFCPDFVWKVGGCIARKAVKGGGGSAAPTALSFTWSQCGYGHVLQRYDVTIGSRQTTFRYTASRNGIAYGRKLSIVCPHSTKICTVLNLWCDAPAPPKPPTAKPVKPPPQPTRYPTQSPTPSTRTCASCLTQQTWTCPYKETCGCNVDNCLPSGTAKPNCSCRTMVPVPWNANHQATIEFCQDVSNSSIYGYRLPGEDSCHLAALMIRVVPGNQYRLTIRNRSNRTTTNLHTHGIHISGNGNADNPLRVVSPDNCMTYHWDIPANHMGGTHWMHSHDMEHGYDQVRGGALAMFVVEENPALLDGVDAASKPGIAAWLRNELLLVASKTLVGHRGNGLANAQFNMTVNEWYRLRILGAEVDGNEFLLRLPFPCTIYTVAHDGVWRFAVPNLASPPEDAEYRMTPAGRLDVAIKCPRQGSFPITAVSTVIANSVIATLNVRPGTTTIATPFTSTGLTWAPHRPSYLQDLMQPSVAVDNVYNISIFSSTINGKKFEMDNPPLDNFTYGSVQEWTVYNAGKPHSYHQHIHHFQVVSCAGHDSGEFYDTILPTDGATPCVLRIRVADYSGSWFLHCHTIVHSEMGAMAMFHVTDGGIVNDNEDYDEFVC